MMKDGDRLDKERTLIKGYLYTSQSINSSTQEKTYLGPLHIRRTLDQSHYFMLTNTSYRDRHQVVLKEARKQSLTLTAKGDKNRKPSSEEAVNAGEPAQDDSEIYPMVMVDQLWLWVIGNTVLTCFPQSWTQKNQKRESDVLDRLLHHLRTNKRRALIREPQDLIDVIVSYCAGVFNRPRSALGLDLHEHFETSVGRAADGEVRLFHTFEKASAIQPTILMETPEGKKQLEKLFNIVPEVRLLEQIKDNVDELRMILRIFNDQALVMTDLASILEQDTQKKHSNQLTQSPQRLDSDFSPHNITTTFTEGGVDGPIRSETISVAYKNRHPIIDANIRDFDRMLSHANASYEALKYLLELKQKHATVTEARFASNRADETARQGDTILFFTIVTIIFGSVSFVTAFFALNVTVFPKDHGVTAWNLGHIAGIVTGVSVGLALPLVAIALMIPTIKEYFQKRKRTSDKSIPKQRTSATVVKTTASEEEDTDKQVSTAELRPRPYWWQVLTTNRTERAAEHHADRGGR
jgi:hypothetical protein